MENRKGFEILQETLKSGETLLWHGASEPCRLLEESDKPRIIRYWIITCVIFAGLFGSFLGVAVDKSAVILLVFALVMAVILYSPCIEWKKLQNQYYGVTNRRIITCMDEEVFSVDMRLVDAVDVKELSTGNRCVLLGRKVVDEGGKQMRWRGGTPAVSGKIGEAGLLFYNVADAEGAVAAVRSARNGL